MNLKLKYSLPAAAALVAGAFFLSCKNDLNVLAPYKESVSVYALLNPNQRPQQLRINKIFLGAGDATVMAQNADSINFAPNAITVTLQRFVNGVQKPTTVGQSKMSITLTETVVTTAPGAFNSTQRLYITNDSLYSSGDYKLIITDNSNGKQFTAQSTIIDSVPPGSTKPFIYIPVSQPVHPFPNTTPLGAYIDYSTLGIQQKIRFKSVPNARLYDVVMRFHYRDTLLDNTVINRYADYNFLTVKSTLLDGTENLEVEFQSDNFFSNIAGTINNAPPVSNLKCRACNYIEYIIYAGSQDLSDFLQVNTPSNTIAQDKPYYTNITNGVGIFAARSKSSIGKDLANSFIDAISTNHYTCPLKFCGSSGSYSNLCQ